MGPVARDTKLGCWRLNATYLGAACARIYWAEGTLMGKNDLKKLEIRVSG